MRSVALVVSITIVVILFFTNCSQESAAEYEPLYTQTPLYKEKKVYTFGVHPLHNPQKLFEVYEPLIEYINAHLEDATLRLEASRNYAAFDQKLSNRSLDFALPNPYQTLMAMEKGYKVFAKMGDDSSFRGIFLVRKDANITDVNQLKGQVVSYPAKTALAATIMPQQYLYEHGIDVMHELQNSYVGSQESSIMNVYLKKSIAGATWPPPWRAFQKEHPNIANELEIAWETEPLINNSLVVKSDVPTALVEEIKKQLLLLHTRPEGKKILDAMELSHYVDANCSDYDIVKEFMNKYNKLLHQELQQ